MILKKLKKTKINKHNKNKKNKLQLSNNLFNFSILSKLPVTRNKPSDFNPKNEKLEIFICK